MLERIRVPDWRHAAVLAALVLAGAPRAGNAQLSLPTGFNDELIANGLGTPVSMVFLPDGRLLVTEKDQGRLRLVMNHSLVLTPVATLDSLRVNSESGLLGVAVDPGWPTRPYVYLQYNWSGGSVMRLVRFKVTGDLYGTGSGLIQVDPSSRFVIFNDLPDASANHNGGTLRFGPDGMLYESLGEDGFPCDAPLKNTMRGKLLRLSVQNIPDGPGSLASFAIITPADNPFVGDSDPHSRLVWAYGLRNPWNFHIDPVSGQIFIADVGQNSYEELDIADAPGRNFGWPAYEAFSNYGQVCTPQDSTGAMPPAFAYDRRSFLNGAAIISGGVYHRPASGDARFPPEYEGDYFFSDENEGFVRRLHKGAAGWTLADPVPGQPSTTDWGHIVANGHITDFLEAADGSLWYCKYAQGTSSFSGEIHRIYATTNTSVPPQGPHTLALERPVPVPSRGPVSTAFTLPEAASARLMVLDVAGRLVRTLIGGETFAAGRHDARWDGRDESGRLAPAGLYVLRLVTPQGAVEQRCLLAR